MLLKSAQIKLSILFLFITSAFNVQATLIGFADTIIEYHYTGTSPLMCQSGEGIGGFFPRPSGVAQFEECLPLSAVLGDDPNYPTDPADYLSLPINSFITLGFTNEYIIDGIGDDIFIQEVGSAQELADIYVSSSFSTNPSDFVYLGQADGDQINSFNLSDINYTDQVRSIKIVSLSDGGFPVATGFDLANVQALHFEVTSVPEPSSIAILSLGIIGLASRRFKK